MYLSKRFLILTGIYGVGIFIGLSDLMRVIMDTHGNADVLYCLTAEGWVLGLLFFSALVLPFTEGERKILFACRNTGVYLLVLYGILNLLFGLSVSGIYPVLGNLRLFFGFLLALGISVFLYGLRKNLIRFGRVPVVAFSVLILSFFLFLTFVAWEVSLIWKYLLLYLTGVLLLMLPQRMLLEKGGEA